jgi:TolB protein
MSEKMVSKFYAHSSYASLHAAFGGRRWLTVVLVTLLALTGGAVGALAAGRVLPSSGELAYYTNRAGNLDVMVADVGRGLEHNLTRHPADDHSPAWSPDGERIAFVSARSGNLDVYIMNADGGDVRQLTTHIADDSNPAWSPDGERLAYESYRDGPKELYLTDSAGSYNIRLTNHGALYSVKPVWSPDGTRLAFYSSNGRDPELYVTDVAARQTHRLTDNRFNDWSPVWSPDGGRLAFFSNSAANWDIYTIDPACAPARTRCADTVRRFTFGESRDYLPAWSPDGKTLAFLSEANNNAALLVLDMACEEAEAGCEDAPYALPVRPMSSEPFAWSPDGAQLAFMGAGGETNEIYVLTLATGALDQVTRNRARDRAPVWRP